MKTSKFMVCLLCPPSPSSLDFALGRVMLASPPAAGPASCGRAGERPRAAFTIVTGHAWALRLEVDSMQTSVEGLRVMVTAGAAGIGRAIAGAFDAGGARVQVCDVDEQALAAFAKECPQVGVTRADVSSRAEVDAFFDAALAHLGGLDVLVNNAGIAGPTGRVEDIRPEDWDKTLAINISGQFYCARRAVPPLKAAGGGAIINLSSSAGVMGFPLRTPYAASKWAVVGFSKSLSMELGAFGIRVNAICPGAVAGPRIDRVIAADAETRGLPVESVRRTYLKQNSLEEFIEPESIAHQVLFLCSPAGRQISGQALSVDGDTHTLSVRD
jgi:NAD(P)-dependent dehydrogenase (short-subunit alcohol dehydrogenase family)